MRKQFTVQYQSYDKTIYNFCRRVINQATLNNRVIVAKRGDFECLVYPNDNWENALKALKIIALKFQVSELESIGA